MTTTIRQRFETIGRGAPQSHGDTTVVPLVGQGGSLEYMLLGAALEARLLTVTEVNESGSVPELQAVSTAEIPVLLLDGEELAGAKQNRILNTTILVPAHGSVVLPVSCTEAGRWDYSTREFADSKSVTPAEIRALKSRSVTQSRSTSESFRSDQGEVWEGIARIEEEMGSHSPTSALRDVVRQNEVTISDRRRSFERIDGQVGFVVLVNGDPIGMDFVSSPVAYADLHEKLLDSYLMDALVRDRRRAASRGAAGKGRRGVAGSGGEDGDPSAGALSFLSRAIGCDERRFPSVGLGDDFRFTGDRIVGNVLVHDDTVVHAAFFHLDDATAAAEDDRPNTTRLAGFLRRRNLRRRRS